MPDRPQSYDPRRFQSTVPYYARYRLGYPEQLIRRVVALVGLRTRDPVLDLGCGPGPLAVSFAKMGMAVTAVDPEPEMLAAIRAAARQEELQIDVRQGSSFDIPEGIGPFRLVVIGRAFHWMERAETLRSLDPLVLPGGAVALFDEDYLKTAENRWSEVLTEVANRYGAAREAHLIARAQPEYRMHESVLIDSPFPVLESVGMIVGRVISADDIVGLSRSRSITALQKLGERAEAFEAELRQELGKLSSEGRFREIADMRALIARRRD
jgi:SAM-dependent methyltransferase